jgi:3-oxoacyl-[acyl-carrier protein] reductase
VAGSGVDGLRGKVALVTGGSRGIGAAVAEELALRGADVVITFRNKAARAEQVAARVRELGCRGMAVAADMTVPEEMEALMARVALDFRRIDVLILNASGGLEKDRASDYPTQLNVTAQERAIHLALGLMPVGGRVVFVTSHLAHFYGTNPLPYAAYEPIAASKHEGERAVRRLVPALSAVGVSLVVVSCDVVEGTITQKLFERLAPGSLERRRLQVGSLPTVDELAQLLVRAADDSLLPTGATLLLGDTRYAFSDDDVDPGLPASKG